MTDLLFLKFNLAWPLAIDANVRMSKTDESSKNYHVLFCRKTENIFLTLILKGCGQTLLANLAKIFKKQVQHINLCYGLTKKTKDNPRAAVKLESYLNYLLFSENLHIWSHFKILMV